MANFNLDQTGGTDIQTTFRFEMEIIPDTELGLENAITAYIVQTDLPSAPGEPIVWHLPGGMKNHQAGKRTVKATNTEFVIPTGNTPDGYQGSVYRMLEKWTNATYSLNKGTNAGKARYCTNGISYKLKGEDNNVRYTFRLLRAQPTDVNYGTVSSESNDLIKVSATFIYDDYQVLDSSGVILRGPS